MSWRPLRSTDVCGSLLLAVFAASCPGGDGDASSGVTRALTVYAEASCDALFHCALANHDKIGHRFVFQDEATCRRVVTRYLQSDISFDIRLWRQREAAGTLVADASKFEACRELGRSCSPFMGQCFEMLEGTVALGGPCQVSEECAGDAYCAFAGGGQACGEGTCKARVPIGELCTSGDACQAGGTGIRSCNYDALETRCIDLGHEVARVGEACGPDIQAGVRRIVTCEKGLWCDLPLEDVAERLSGTCKPPLMLGAACDDSSDVCEGAAVCAREGARRSCQKPTLLHADEPCNDPTALALCDVYGGFTCGKSNVCVALGDGSAGSRCDSSELGELVPCNTGLHCAAASNTCEPLRELGQSCEADSECESNYCDALSQQCRADACDDVAGQQVSSD